MNYALIGTADKTAHLLKLAGPRFLLIDDGPIAEAFLDHFPRAKLFDIATHSYNPLKGMDYKRARDVVAALYSASPGGDNTLTVRNGKRALLRLLLNGPQRFTDLPSPRETKDDSEKEALAMIEELWLSPVLYRVLCNPTNFSFKGQVVVRLNRAEIGDFDAFLLAALLIGQSKGQVIVPDFGFYGRPFHLSLIRQERLVAGLDRIADLPQGFALNHFQERIPAKATWEDAEVLAMYAGKERGTRGAADFIEDAVG